MDAEGGEKLEILARLYELLLTDAVRRGTLRDDFYHLSDSVLIKFKLFQGFDPTAAFDGGSLEQACSIWKACPQHLLKAVLAANGLDQTWTCQTKIGGLTMYYARADVDL